MHIEHFFLLLFFSSPNVGLIIIMSVGHKTHKEEMWCVSISTPVLSHVIYCLWGKQHTYVSLKCILCASVRALIFSIKWFEIFWFEYLLLMRDYHYHGLSMHLFSCIHKCKCNAHSHMYGKTILFFFIKAICNLFPFKFNVKRCSACNIAMVYLR